MLPAINLDGNALKPAVKAGSRLVESLLGGPFRAAAGLMEDQIYAWQWSNRITIAEKAAKKIEGRTISPETMPPGFLMPLLEAAGSVEDESLQKMWASLLASAAIDPSHRQPLFVQVLKGLSPTDAANYRTWFRDAREHTYPTQRDCVVTYSEAALDSATRLAVLGILQTGSVMDGGEAMRGVFSVRFGLIAHSLWKAIEEPLD